ncbi:polysaccharide deacetylase family protein [Heyndrickxia sp. NPDC080065]|uniref:polysaccharide deacetylase family protein n=1 Tax=Heyndrickxia sp. NPDC080065 TaxID=3390568 RepID=UPI003CFEB394
MKNLIGLSLIAILTLLIVNNPLTERYLSQLKADSGYIAAGQNVLYNQIVQAAEKYSIKPQDAKIDRVWKAIPGYNGVKVDIKASYNNMKKDKNFDENKLVFEQIPPKIHLKDLPPSPLYRGNPDKPMVSFLINVAWGNEYLPSILKTLKENNIHATFFLEGRWVKENPELARMIVDSGHEVGNHSYTHPDMKTLSSERVREQLINTNQVIKATTGKQVYLFAPPSGGYRDEVVDIAHSMNLRTIMWSVDTIDWQNPTPETIINRVIPKVHPGALILMHPTESTSKALKTLIMEIKRKQLRIGTVSKLMDEERIIKVNDGKINLGKDKDTE